MTDYLTTADLARKTGFSSRYFRRLAVEGKVPGAYQPSDTGGAWRFNKKSFARWWRSKEKKQDQWQSHTNEKDLHTGGAKYTSTESQSGLAFEQRLDLLLENGYGKSKTE